MTNILKKIYQRLKKPPDQQQEPKLKKLSERMRKLFRKKKPAAHEKPSIQSEQDKSYVNKEADQSNQSGAPVLPADLSIEALRSHLKTDGVRSTPSTTPVQSTSITEKQKQAQEAHLDEILHDFDEEDEDEAYVDLLEDDDAEELIEIDEDNEEDEEDELDEDEEDDALAEYEDEDEEEEDLDDEVIHEQIMREYGSNLSSASLNLEALAKLTEHGSQAELAKDAIKLINLNDAEWGKGPHWQTLELLSSSKQRVVQKINVINPALLSLLQSYHLIPDHQSTIILTTNIAATDETMQQLIHHNQMLTEFYNKFIKVNNYLPYYNLQLFARHQQKMIIFSAYEANGSADECLLKVLNNHSLQDNPATFLLLTMFANIFYGLQQFHAAGLLHLNIAAHHVLVDEKYQGKLGHFFTSETLAVQHKSYHLSGDIFWIDQAGLNGNLSRATDLFALKMTMLEMICYAVDCPITHLLAGMTLTEFHALTQRSGNQSAISLAQMSLKNYLLNHTQTKICQELLQLLNVFADFLSWHDDIENENQMKLAQPTFKHAYDNALTSLRDMYHRD